MHIELWQWALLIVSALLTGISKTAIPGSGILSVTTLAFAFGGRQSVGILLPMLIISDIFAVSWYRQHAQWDKLVSVVPGVLTGLAVGATALWLVGGMQASRDILAMIIGGLTLLMLATHLLRSKLDERFAPTSPMGILGTGVFAGFATMVSNAAGPVMTIYMTAHKLPKKEMIGTLAWFFFILNLSKMPIYICLTLMNPREPIVTGHSLLLAACSAPALALGALTGKLVLPRIPQKQFEVAVLALAGVGAVKLLIG